MTFEILETHTKANMPARASLSYLRGGRNGKSKEGTKPRLQITIPSKHLSGIKGDWFLLMMGTGSDRGKLRIHPATEQTKGAVKTTQFTHAFSWRFGYVPRLGDDIFDGEKCEFAIRDNGIDITIREALLPGASSQRPKTG